MKNVKLYIIEIILFISIIMFNILVKNVLCLYGSIIIITLISLYLFGFYRDKSYLKGSVNRIVISSLLSFFLISYSLGLFVGYNRTPISLNISYLIENVLLLLGVTTCIELLRYIIIKKSKKSLKPMIFYAVIISILNIIIEINGYNFFDREIVFIFISTIVLPVISREFLCSYLTYKVGLIPSLIFKIVIVLYPYVFPIIPNLGDYIYSVMNIVLIYIIFYFSSKSILYAEKSNKYSKRVSNRIVYLPILAMLIFLVILVSGIFKYKLIAIGSNSMSPVYVKGDAIIYRKIEDINELKIGDIIAFKVGGIVVTHRIVSVKVSNGTYFITKGDANKSIDSFDVSSSDVLGKVEYKIKYIGYPTIWINDFFNRGEMNYEN